MSVIWITGLSGAGKSTLAREVARLLIASGIDAMLLDGDAVRGEFADRAYDRSGRLAAAQRLSRLAADFSAQGRTVVVATISLFHEIHAANRIVHRDYMEIVLQCADTTLRKRSAVYADDAERVVGRGILAEFPLAPHLTLENDGDASPECLARRIVERWTLHVGL